MSNFYFDVRESVWDIDGKILTKIDSKNLDELQKLLSFLEKNLNFKDIGEDMSTTQNFNFNNSNQNPNINAGSGIQNITQNITQSNETIGISEAKKLFDIGMFPVAKEKFRKIVAMNPEDKEVCMYYLLSSLSDINIRSLSDSNVSRMYAMIERFRDDDFFKLLWLIVFYEHSDVNGLGDKKYNLLKEMQSGSCFTISDQEKKLLSGLKISSKKASILLQ
ncbi:hypothetical protein HMY34_10310 [Thiothrix subterranea]|uniref:hypothetical protein n=1 Tax=Thiothrix subterranea TaxID=2735563 RepID=UPI00192BDB11|nr:hypothetical protein [Thiothrix subterranea]QQZ29125.1 hypothetical protein HMY34_10310 [Thiothrix subterranea]